MRQPGNCELPHEPDDTLRELFSHAAGSVLFRQTEILIVKPPMIGSRLMERWMLKISPPGDGSHTKLDACGQHSSPCGPALLARGACVRLIDDHRGSVVPAVAIMLTVLLGLAALGTEVGTWYGTKRNMQGAADTAAYSAAIAKNAPPGTSAVFIAQAKSVAGNYGYVDASNNVTVAVK